MGHGHDSSPEGLCCATHKSCMKSLESINTHKLCMHEITGIDQYTMSCMQKVLESIDRALV